MQIYVDEPRQSLYPSVCLSVYLSVCISVCISVCLSIFHPSVHPSSVCVSVCLYICLYICLSVHLPSIWPSVRPSVRPSVCLISVCLIFDCLSPLLIYLFVCSLLNYLNVCITVRMHAFLCVRLSVCLSAWKPLSVPLCQLSGTPAPEASQSKLEMKHRWDIYPESLIVVDTTWWWRRFLAHVLSQSFSRIITLCIDYLIQIEKDYWSGHWPPTWDTQHHLESGLYRSVIDDDLVQRRTDCISARTHRLIPSVVTQVIHRLPAWISHSPASDWSRARQEKRLP